MWKKVVSFMPIYFGMLSILRMEGFLNVFAQYLPTIRVMTYNINAQGHGYGSYDDIANVIKELKPDIAGLQKLDSCNSRNPLDVGKWLGEQTNLYFTFAPSHC